MYNKTISILFTLMMLSFTTLTTTQAHAGLIAVEDWHYTGDSFGGLRQHDNLDNVYYALGNFGMWNANATYEAIDGFHFATFAEYMAIINSSGVTNWSTLAHYRNRGDWNSYYAPDGQMRVLFRFADTTTNKQVVHASHSPIQAHSYTYGPVDNYSRQAGFIMIKDPVSVPEPSTLAIFSLGVLGFIARKAKR